MFFVDVTAVCILEAFQNQQSMLLADKVLKQLGKEKAKDKYKVRMGQQSQTLVGTDLNAIVCIQRLQAAIVYFTLLFSCVCLLFLRIGSLLCHLLSSSNPILAHLLMT